MRSKQNQIEMAIKNASEISLSSLSKATSLSMNKIKPV